MKFSGQIASFTIGIGLLALGVTAWSHPLHHKQIATKRPAHQTSYKTAEQGTRLKGVQLVARLSSASKTRFAPLEPIVVHLALTNASGKLLTFVETASSLDYELIVKDAQGRTMPPTRYGYREKGTHPPSLATALTSLPGGQTKQYIIVVNRMADMTREEAYSITVRRFASAGNTTGNTEGYAESNTLHVVVKSQDTIEGRKVLPGGAIAPKGLRRS